MPTSSSKADKSDKADDVSTPDTDAGQALNAELAKQAIEDRKTREER